MFSALQTKIIVFAVFIVVITLYKLHQTTTIITWPTHTTSVSFAAPTGASDRMARYLSPAELMARPLPGAQASIPKIFHQSWSSSELPAKFKKWSETCRRQHPDWEWVLWTDDDNRELVEKFVPGMKKAYEGLKGPIMRADIVRNAYLHLFGGVYADLDMDCLRPTDELFANFSVSTVDASLHLHSNLAAKDPSSSSGIKQKAFVGRMGTDDGFEHSIPNAWMASPPGHPLFKMMLQWATKKVTSDLVLDSRPEAITGPIALKNGIERFKKGHFGVEALILPDIFSDAVKTAYAPADDSRPLEKDASIEVLPFQYIYPYSWYRDGDMFRKFCWSTLDTFNPERCKQLVAVDHWPSWTITYWSHTWNNEDRNGGNIKKLEDAKG